MLSKANLERTKQTAPELFGAATIGAACILAPLAFMVEGSKLSVLDDGGRAAGRASGLFLRGLHVAWEQKRVVIIAAENQRGIRRGGAFVIDRGRCSTRVGAVGLSPLPLPQQRGSKPSPSWQE